VTDGPWFRDPDHRLVTRGNWRIRITEKPALNFRFGLEHEFATDPDPGFPRNSVRVTTGVEAKF
jgi:hypothetical protein